MLRNMFWGSSDSGGTRTANDRYKARDEISREKRRQLTEAASEINFDEEARKILSARLNLDPDDISNSDETMNDYDAIYRSPIGGDYNGLYTFEHTFMIILKL
jgi:hypothetical protein